MESREIPVDYELTSLVLTKDCARLNQYLKAKRERVNAAAVRSSEMLPLTGLEWAIWKSNWKPLAPFFVRGADPNNHLCEGLRCPVHGSRGLVLVKEFGRDDLPPIEGLEGL